ncbi:helix-turn-helix transcriptional regulator [Vitreimonas sp.]|uniref:helix-turn-helix domain-containing protein n=1 Tax=Vitreimonas sp. TaxID=3069702 RepID=UPI0032C2117B
MARGRTSSIALLSRQVVRLRRRTGWTQEELAHQAGMSRSYVTDIEGRKRNITLKTLDKLAIALGVSCAELLGD